VPWVSNRALRAKQDADLAEHKDECSDRYRTIADGVEKLSDKTDRATVMAVAAANDAKIAAVEAANNTKTAVSDLERRLQKWLIALLLAVLGTACTQIVHLPPLHWGG